VLALTLEQLKQHPKGQHAELVNETLAAAEQKGLIESTRQPYGVVMAGVQAGGPSAMLSASGSRSGVDGVESLAWARAGFAGTSPSREARNQLGVPISLPAPGRRWR
jgi:hypothetical protein